MHCFEFLQDHDRFQSAKRFQIFKADVPLLEETLSALPLCQRLRHVISLILQCLMRKMLLNPTSDFLVVECANKKPDLEGIGQKDDYRGITCQ